MLCPNALKVWLWPAVRSFNTDKPCSAFIWPKTKCAVSRSPVVKPSKPMRWFSMVILPLCIRACWGLLCHKRRREETNNVPCQRSPGPSMPRHRALHWTGTMFSFKITMPLNSKTFSTNKNCPMPPRCMSVPKTEAPAAYPATVSDCCAWSTHPLWVTNLF